MSPDISISPIGPFGIASFVAFLAALRGGGRHPRPRRRGGDPRRSRQLVPGAPGGLPRPRHHALRRRPTTRFSTQNFASAARPSTSRSQRSTDGVNWSPDERRRAARTPVVGQGRRTRGRRASLRSTAASSSCTTPRPRPVPPATSASASRCPSNPLGPVHRTDSQPIVCQDGNGWPGPTITGNANGGGSIDPDIFTDFQRRLVPDLEERREPRRAAAPPSGPTRSATAACCR